MYILGISAYYHDSSACLIKNGEILSATQEERFSRIKHDSNFPKESIVYCLNEAEIKLEDIDYITFFDKPMLKFNRLLETYLAFAPRGYESFSKSFPSWINDKLFQKNKILKELKNISKLNTCFSNKLLFSEHHLSHAASAFYPSPFKDAAVLTMDGVGEWTTTSLAIGEGNKLRVIKEIKFPHSLGLLYSAFTYYTGFKVNSGEYKLMGLAPYGKPIYSEKIIKNLIDIKSDGSFHLDMSYFNYCTGMTMTNNKFNNLFDGPRREPESEITQKEMDLAASIQKVTEEIVIKLAQSALKITGMQNLCLAGGVALNCVANGELLKKKIFKKIWVQPAAGDAGGALGAALASYYLMLNENRIVDHNDSMKGSYLGPKFENSDVKLRLNKLSTNFKEYSENELVENIAKALADGKAIGLMNGRMEFGPRALGARSIIADPRSPLMQKNLNLKVKFRESFRPFAPSILKEDISDWFEMSEDSPYMLMVAKVLKSKRIDTSNNEKELFGIDKLNIPRSLIPATTHVDYSARIQTVDKKTNPRFHAIISEFKKITGCPILVNTSFNVRGEPIVLSPEDAFQCFMGTDLDYLVIENIMLDKNAQDLSLRKSYEKKYELD